MDTESQPPLRWGVLGAANIVRRNWAAMIESGAATLCALASRDPDRAGRFIDEMQAESPWPVRPTAHGSYQSLLATSEVDAVYVPLPTGVRKRWVIRAAETGKHVLCEKPCAVSAADLAEMIAACERNNVLFMDGVMFMHDRRYPHLREILDDGETIGEVRRITSAFSFRGDAGFAEQNIRGNASLEPTGCLGDLGWYCLRAALWAMNWELPVRVSGRVLEKTDDGVPMEFSGELDFESGATSAFHCSFTAPDQMWLNISGRQGSLRVSDFVFSREDAEADWEVGRKRITLPGDQGTSSAARMFQRFSEDARGDVSKAPWAEISLKTQRLQDACELSSRAGRAVVLDRDGRYA